MASGFCGSEADARKYLKAQDPALYEVLAKVWSDNDDATPSGVMKCGNRPSGLYDLGK